MNSFKDLIKAEVDQKKKKTDGWFISYSGTTDELKNIVKSIYKWIKRRFKNVG